MVIFGGAICAAGVFIMALPTEWFLAAANSGIGQWLGHAYLGVRGNIHPYYIMAALYLIVFSIGEAFYSPRVYEYAAAIAPPGRKLHTVRWPTFHFSLVNFSWALAVGCWPHFVPNTAHDIPGRCG
jgi:hypothetical protein